MTQAGEQGATRAGRPERAATRFQPRASAHVLPLPAAGVITEQFLKEQGTLLRGLAHPVIFAQTLGSGGGDEDGSSVASSANGSADVEQKSRSGLPAWDPNRMFNSALQGALPVAFWMQGQGGWTVLACCFFHAAALVSGACCCIEYGSSTLPAGSDSQNPLQQLLGGRSRGAGRSSTTTDGRWARQQAPWLARPTLGIPCKALLHGVLGVPGPSAWLHAVTGSHSY